MKLAALGVLLMVGCGSPDPAASFQQGEKGRVVRVIDGDALVLNTGQSVRLIGIEAPAPERRDRPGQAYAKESSRLLEDMALGRDVELRYAGLTRDRYDRALAHVFTDDALGPPLWLNAEMVRRGGARVRIYPDTAAGSAPLLLAEEEARGGALGLWKTSAYSIPNADDLPDDFMRFQLVLGLLGEADDAQDAACLRPLLNSWLSLEIAASAQSICDLPVGARVEARGYVYDGQMEIIHPLNVRTLER